MTRTKLALRFGVVLYAVAGLVGSAAACQASLYGPADAGLIGTDLFPQTIKVRGTTTNPNRRARLLCAGLKLELR